MTNPIGRRRFLMAAAAVSPALAANSRPGVGIIGVGNLGLRHIRDRLMPLHKNGEIQLLAACDIYEKAKERARERIGLEARAVHHDYRDMLARKDVDAVVIVVPEHLHHRMTLDALRAGKDVYLEKPMTLTIPEARELDAAVRRTGRVLQVGSQYVSDPRYHAAKDIIERGLIGPVMGVQASWCASSMYGLWQYKIEPEATARTVDWKAFLGPAPPRPFSAERYFRWRKYWDYSGGIPADLFYHELSPLLYAVGPRFPVRVSAHGGIRVFKDREVPDVFSMTAEYTDFSIELSGMSTASALGRSRPKAIFGREASITFPKGGVLVTPEPLFKKKFEAAAGKPNLTVEPKLSDYEQIRMVHMRDFLTSMKTRRQPVFDVGLGYRVTTAIKLGVDSYRQNRMMFFDPQREAVVDRAPQRPGYEGTGENYEEPGLALPDGRQA